VNVIGVQEAAKLNIFLAIMDLLTQVGIVILGAVLVLSPETLVNNVDFGTSPTVTDFLIAIPVGMVAFTGIDTISNMAEEARDQAKTIPAAMKRVVAAVMAISLTLPAVALSAMPVENGSTPLGEPASQGGYAGDPITGLVVNLGLEGGAQSFLKGYVGLLAATILLVATNAGLIGLSRLSYSMGQYRQLPEKLRQLHPRFRTPYVAIMVFGAIACLTMIPGQADFLGTVYAFGAMLSFTVAHASVIALRIKQPDAERPWRGPGNIRFRGYDLPLFAIAGGLGTFAAFVAVTFLNLVVLVFGGLWLAMGMTVYYLYRRHLGLKAGETRKIITPDPVVEHEVEYESILVAFEDGQYSNEAVAMAVRLAARRRRGIHILVTITVPANAPIDASMPEAESKAQAAVDQARVRGGRRVTGHHEKVRAGGAGRRIVSEAREIHAAAIVMPMPVKRAGTSLFGRTLETVLAERPCRVIIDSSVGMDQAKKTVA
ncbi:MAG TPA: universal stress protein, partial [Thermoleophilaceae bacterium]|nr:universal stress protein [Thermoleophilaceae bacterium]